MFMNICEDRCDYPGVSGKLYLVTGASSGIGRACAILLSRLGATAIINGRDNERLCQTAEEMSGESHILAPGDLLALDFAPWLREQCEKAGLPLSGVAHCAGNGRSLPLRGFRPEKLARELEEHTVVSAKLFQACAALKSRAPQCSLAVMTSISASYGIPGNALYGAARAAMDSLCRSFAVEYACLGIRCNSVCGGFMRGTAMTGHFLAFAGRQYLDKANEFYPLGTGEPQAAANALVFLLGSASAWITGIQLIVDGGYSARGF